MTVPCSLSPTPHGFSCHAGTSRPFGQIVVRARGGRDEHGVNGRVSGQGIDGIDGQGLGFTRGGSAGTGFDVVDLGQLHTFVGCENSRTYAADPARFPMSDPEHGFPPLVP